jgi:subtilisin family serine protease
MQWLAEHVWNITTGELTVVLLGHGTHVAGIIGADPLANPFNISGVAFSASISAYRVLGCSGGLSEDS